MSRRRSSVLDTVLRDRNVDGLCEYLETHGGGAVLTHAGRKRCVKQLLAMLQPSLAHHFLRPPAQLERVVFRELARLSPAHARFVACWAHVRHEVDQGTLYNDLAEGTHTRSAGEEKVFVKVHAQKSWYDEAVKQNEVRFSQVSVALTLTGLSAGAVPFSYTGGTADKMVCVSAYCGQTVAKIASHFDEIAFQGLMAIGEMRLYGGLLHLDCHMDNVTAVPVAEHTLFWAVDYATGLARAISGEPELLEGFELAGCTTRVTIIDGGLSAPVSEGRTMVRRAFGDKRSACGWEKLDVGQEARMLGWDILTKVTVMKDGQRTFVPVLHFDDIPDSAVDTISFLVCLYFRGGEQRDGVLKILGMLVRIVRADPEFGMCAFLKFMARAGQVLGCVSFVSRVRLPTDLVIPLPEPGPEVDALIEATRLSVFQTQCSAT